MTLLWLCDSCSLPVLEGQGWVHIPLVDVALAEASAWDVATWAVHHSHCDQTPSSNDYWIEVGRIRTTESALDWTLHLARKRWYASTDWPAFIRRGLLAARQEVAS